MQDVVHRTLTEQLLLLLGVKADAASQERPLCIEDVSVLGMEVQSSWTGAAVADFIRRNMRLRPAASLSYVICDQGTNLLAALKSLALSWASDCSHVMMNLAKALFKDDAALSRLCASCWHAAPTTGADRLVVRVAAQPTR